MHAVVITDSDSKNMSLCILHRQLYKVCSPLLAIQASDSAYAYL